MSKSTENKTRGFRETSQQQLILNYLLRCENHPTAEEIFAVVKTSLPRISLATVYRNLRKLEDHNLISSLSYSKRQARFEFGVKSHYHFICSKCDKVIHIEMDDLVHLNSQIAKRHGLQIDNHRLYFFGLCKDCQV